MQTANAQGVTIWALDASGSGHRRPRLGREPDDGDAALRLRAAAELSGPAPDDGRADRRAWRRSTPTTGRRAWTTSSADFSNFYSLGFRSTKAAGDKPHRIEVEVKRKGLKVRARHGLRREDRSRRRRPSRCWRASSTRATRTRSGSASRWARRSRYDNENYLLPVRISIPIGKLGLVPSGDRYEGTFFVYFVVLDASDKQSDLAVQRQKVEIPATDFEKAQDKDYYYDVSADLRARAARSSRSRCATASPT